MNKNKLGYPGGTLFKVLPDPDHWVLTAIAENGEQYLGLIQTFGLYVAEFSKGGTFQRAWEHSLSEEKLDAVYRKDLTEFQNAIGKSVSFNQPLSLLPFQTEKGWGLSGLTPSMEETISEIDQGIENDEAEEDIIHINAWVQEGAFYFHWGGDYHCNKDGVIESS